MRLVALLLLAAPALHAQQSPYPTYPAEKIFVASSNPDEKSVGQIGVSKFGLIYVLDRLPCTVRVFEATGKFVRKFGQAGTGNGQCMRPQQLLVSDTGVLVFETAAGPPPAARRILSFTLDGKHKSTELEPPRAPFAPPQVQPGGPAADTGRLMRGGARLFGGRLPPNILFYAVQNPGSTTRDTLFKYPLDIAVIERQGRSGQSPTGFGAGGVSRFFGDSLIVFADGISGEVKWFSFDEKGVSVKRTENIGIKPIPISPAEVTERENQMAALTRMPPTDGSTTPTSLPPGSIKITGAPTVSSVASELLVSSDDAVWISNTRRETYRTAAAESPYIDVRIVYTIFPATGTPYAVKLPVGFIIQRVIGDKIFGSFTTKGGEPMVYQIKR